MMMRDYKDRLPENASQKRAGRRRLFYFLALLTSVIGIYVYLTPASTTDIAIEMNLPVSPDISAEPAAENQTEIQTANQAEDETTETEHISEQTSFTYHDILVDGKEKPPE
jgi:hypothetical protein